MKSLEGCNILIIGGGSGIGLATAKEAAAQGATVWIAGRSADRLARAAESIPEARTVVADVSQGVGFLDGLPQLDHVVLSVAASVPGTIAGCDLAAARKAFDTKFWAAWQLGAACAGKLRGSLNLVSGAAARKPMRGMTTLTPLNAAVEGLVKALAVELAPIRVNSIAPGMIDTPYWKHRLPSTEARDALFQQSAAGLPAGRIGQPEDCAKALLYLMTADWVTGTVLDVDGGFQLT